MLTTPPPEAQHLSRAGQALREQLHRLDGAAPGQPLAELLAALDEYEAAVLACVPTAPAWQLNPTPTLAELRAEREACPLYRLGWVRGYQAGQAAGQQRAEPALGLYARHANLPTPPNPTALMQQVRRFIEQLQQRRAGGSLRAACSLPTRPA